MLTLTTAKVRAEYSVRNVPRDGEHLIQKITRKINPRSNYPNGWRVLDDSAPHLSEIRNEFDLIWFFELYSAEMLPNLAWPRSVVDIDDVPSIFERTCAQDESMSSKVTSFVRAWSLERRERYLAERFSVLSVCSQKDLDYFQQIGVRAPIHVIPNGFERPRSEPTPVPVQPPRIGFIGHFSHPPNHDGIQWYLQNCWAQVKRQIPDAQLRLVGPGSDEYRAPSAPDIHRLGCIADPAAEIKTWSLMIVPIRMGSGTCVKIAEGFSQRCPIVSTSFGAQGFMCDSDLMYIADSAESFAELCVAAIREPVKAAQMAERAWEQYLRRWTWDAIRPTVEAVVDDCLRGIDF
jgi:glycosyltransferase involved in cell wall biosynthesis